MPIDTGWPTPSQVIRLASGNDHLLIAGDRGCDQERLARAIHSISPMRKRDIVWMASVPKERSEQKELLVRASRTTLVLTIDDKMPVMDEAFRTSLFSTSYRIRVLVIASSSRAIEVLGPEHSRMRRIDLRPLAFRSAQLGRLLDLQLEERGSGLRFAQLSEAHRKACSRTGGGTTSTISGSPPSASPRSHAQVRFARRPRTFGWGLAGAGVLGAGVSGVLFLDASSLRDDANNASTQEDADRLHERADTRQLVATIIGIGGLGLMVTGAIKLAIHDDAQRRSGPAGGSAHHRTARSYGVASRAFPHHACVTARSVPTGGAWSWASLKFIAHEAARANSGGTAVVPYAKKLVFFSP